MMKRVFNKQEGFTLIELMIVVAIIGILAAIAIPNFLTYQMKSRQSEAKTNLQAIRTSELSFQGEHGCYLGLGRHPAERTFATGNKSAPIAWNAPAVRQGTAFCTVTFDGNFTEIGFVASGNVYYTYAAQTSAGPNPIAACALGPNEADGSGSATAQLGFNVTAASDLDGDGLVSYWAASNDNGANDCRVGVY